MMNCFIINSSAGNGRAMPELATALKHSGVDFKIYRTKSPLDATRFVRKYCTEHPDEEVRFFACGGDGTLKEVVNGAVGFKNVEIGCYPCGSGNDFVKYYGSRKRFTDIKRLVKAPTVQIDLIKIGDIYSVNVANFGFDAFACRTMNEVKGKPIIGGKNAYYFGVMKGLFNAMQTEAKVYADGKLLNEDGTLLLCTAANGSHYGGAFNCAPKALNNDGLMELCLVKPMSRTKFVKLVNSYKNGNHLEDPNFSEYITYCRCKKAEFKADEDFAVTIDGELAVGNSFTCEVIPKAINFILPEEI